MYINQEFTRNKAKKKTNAKGYMKHLKSKEQIDKCKYFKTIYNKIYA